MDEETARRLLFEDDAAVRERLGWVLRQRAIRTRIFADALTPWLHGAAWARSWMAEWEMSRRGMSGGPWGRLKPAARYAFASAFDWAKEAHYSWRDSAYAVDSWGRLQYDLQSLGYHLPTPNFNSTIFERDFREPPFEYRIISQRRALIVIEYLHNGLDEYAAQLEKSPSSRLPVSSQIAAPQYAQLGEGVLARTFIEDLERLIDGCRLVEAHLASATDPDRLVAKWAIEVEAFLLRCLGGEAKNKFGRIVGGVPKLAPRIQYGLPISGYSFVTDKSITILQAYVALGRVYLEKVRMRVSDYAEASGQNPPISMDFRGATIYGGQFAAIIKNIESIIAGIHQQGDTDMAEALGAIQKAILGQQGLPDADRSDLLDHVKYLAEAAATPPQRRNRGIVKSVIAALSTAAATSTELGQAVQTWDGVLHQLTR